MSNSIPRAKTWFFLFALVAATAVSYWPTLRNGFIWDDDSYVTQNTKIRSWDGFKKIWIKPGAVPQYYPLVFSTFALEYHLWGLNASGYHAVNVFFHICNALLLFFLLRKLKIPGAELAALVFALHPVHVESVAWISELKNLLSGFFYFLTLLVTLRFFEKDSSLKVYALALLLFALALLSKTTTCTLPGVALILVWWRGRKISIQDVLFLLPFVLVAVTFSSFTVMVEKHIVGTGFLEWDLSRVDRALIAGRALWFYVGKIIWPVRLAFNYPRWAISSLEWRQYIYPVTALLTLVLAWTLRNRIGRGLFAALAIFALTLFPALGFIIVYPMRYSFVADHFQYLASIPIIILISFALTRVRAYIPLRRFSVVVLFLGSVAVCLGTMTHQQAKNYKDLRVLWESTLKTNPGSILANNNLAVLYFQEQDYRKAIPYFIETIKTDPSPMRAWTGLGSCYSKLGQYEESMKCFEKAVTYGPTFAQGYLLYGEALYRAQRFDKALAKFELAIRFKPELKNAYIGAGKATLMLGKKPQAVSILEGVIAQWPEDNEARESLAIAYLELGRRPLALKLIDTVGNPEALSSDTQYEAGKSLISHGESERGLIFLKFALQNEQDDVKRAAIEKLIRKTELPG